MFADRSQGIPRFGIVTLTHEDTLYSRMDEIKRRLYAARPHCFVYNGADRQAVHDTDLTYVSDDTHPSGIPMMIEKFVWFLEEFLDKEPWTSCSHIVRANASTFLNLPLLERCISRLPSRGCYAGRLSPGHRFVSGTCIILSRDSATALVRAYHNGLIEFAKSIEDDIVIATAMKRNRVRMRNVPMAYLIENIIPDDTQIASLLARYPLIRVRNDADREHIDISIWNALDRVSSAQANR